MFSKVDLPDPDEPDDGDQLPLTDVQVNTLEHVQGLVPRTVVLMNVVQFDHGF